MFKKFQIKDFVFLAILAAVMTLAGGITMPLVMHTTVFGLRNMVAAPLYALFCAVGLMKVRKPGAMTIMGIFSGAPLAFMSPVMFFNNFVAALFAEIIIMIIFRGYKNKASVFVTAGLWMPFTVPVTILFSMWLNGTSFGEIVTNPTSAILVTIGTVVLGFVGSAIGMKIAKELQKAGKLKPYGEEEPEDD
ncbi:MAG: MptD family putative ECF transporter S component [Ruminococcus sp.]|nr:MptD family putative ECF transporter S component [Ruminococcus sp.]